ncbi:MAG: topoisomerase II [Planctomycetota bacterium]
MPHKQGTLGSISDNEAYSKQETLRRLEVSQKVWDKMLDEGLPYTIVGHSRWVTGKNLIEHFSRNAERKRET